MKKMAKTNLVMGVILGLSLSQSAFAAALRGADTVRSAITEGDKKALDKNSVESMRGLTKDSEILDKSSEILNRISGADATELKSALSRKIKVKELDGEKTVSLMEISIRIVKADESVRKIDRNELSAEGKAHLALIEDAIKISSEFMSLANRTSDMKTTLSEQTSKEVAAFNKQLSLIPDMLSKMDTLDLKGHVEIMKKAVAARTSPSINGDQAFAAALKAGKTAEKYNEKLDEILGCIR